MQRSEYNANAQLQDYTQRHAVKQSWLMPAPKRVRTSKLQRVLQAIAKLFRGE